MFSKFALFTAFLVGANCFYINQEFNRPLSFNDLEELYSEEPLEYVQPVYVRQRRQVQGVVNTDPDGTTNILAKLPLASNDKNILSAIGGLDGLKSSGGLKAVSAGLAWENVNGHGLTLTGKHIPNF